MLSWRCSGYMEQGFEPVKKGKVSLKNEIWGTPCSKWVHSGDPVPRQWSSLPKAQEVEESITNG